jgi:uncharacterized damage-inducible protein DinB
MTPRKPAHATAFALAVLGAMLLAPASPRADDAALPAGMRGEVLMWFKDAESKLEQLSAAMPEAKYGWRPGQGVRSVGEVYMHVAASNLGIPAMCGIPAPSGFTTADAYEKSLTKKADIEKALKDSFAHMEQAWTSLSEADLEKPVDLFGIKTTVRGGFLLVLSHCHEHLGQSIAYARMNGVVPPWTAKQQAAAKAEGDKAKAGKP